MKIDLHVHSSHRSPCCKITAREQIKRAIECGLDGLVITDHDSLVPESELVELQKEVAPFRVFGGIEINVPGEHILVLGIQDSLLETTEWDFPELYTFVMKRGGFMALAHPFRYREELRINFGAYPLHALELESCNTPSDSKRQIKELAEQYNMSLLSNSDSHNSDMIGRHYNILNRTPEDENELIEILISGEFKTKNG